MKIQGSLIRPTDTMDVALRVIDGCGGKLALVLNDAGQLVGTVSDGDARRALLRGLTLSTPVSEVMNRHPTVITPDSDHEAVLQVMRDRVLRHVPVVNAQGHVVALHAIEDFITPAPRDNWVVLLAGGEGRRLRPLTADCPKPMLPLGERPLLERSLLNLKGMGFRHFYLSVNYMAEKIIDHFGDGSRLGVEIRYLHEDRPLGTAGPLSLLPELPKTPLVVMNGDILTRLHFPTMIEFHDEHEAAATMAVREYEVQVPYGVINVDEMRITGIEEKPVMRHLISAGIYVLSPEVLASLPAATRLDMPDLFTDLAKADRRTHAFLLREYWIDIGHMDDLSRARRDFNALFPGD